MSRKRSISTDMSTDGKINELAQFGTFPPLLYTWCIPHADDWGRLTGNAREVKMLVCASLDVTVREVDEAIDQIAQVGLWLRYEVDGRLFIQFPQEAWYRWQSYIGKDKRTNDKSTYPAPPQNAAKPEPTNGVTPNNAEERRETPQNPVSPSPSPSDDDAREGTRNGGRTQPRSILSAEECQDVDDRWAVETCIGTLISRYPRSRIEATISKAKETAKRTGDPITDLTAYVTSALTREDARISRTPGTAPPSPPEHATNTVSVDALRKHRERMALQ